jgi:fluoroquinolone resistance protein
MRLTLSQLIKTDSSYTSQVFRKQMLDGFELNSCGFYDCKFLQCSFVESSLIECRFINCTFDTCDLSLLHLPRSKFSQVRFTDSKLAGVNWALADWPEAGLGEPLNFFKCVLNHATFIGLKLPGMKIIDCIAVDVDFREADLSGVDFSGTDLSKSLFIHTDLSKADLSKARNYQIDVSQNVLKSTRFSLPEAMSLLYNLDIILGEGEDGFLDAYSKST